MLRSVGLGGDGDEVEAIEAAFARFGLPVPVEDARRWRTVGDIWTSLMCLVPRVESQPRAWERLVEALCEQTGADAAEVTQETRLLA